MSRLGDPRHRERRQILRSVGPVVLLTGVMFVAIGTISFFSSFGTFGPPRYFWCAFVGMPLIFVGTVITKMAYFGSVLRYIAEETTPVGVDTFNTVAHGTKESVRDLASAVGQGINAGLTGRAVDSARRCRECGEENDADARYCDGCGQQLARDVSCPKCGAHCDPDARFCDQCGAAMA
ncbi:MAG: zinc ribbon domain-containing protein [Planctomycetota bacterium]|nr:zinc ribbon domain-containing protein [Planctomycetota bacterium]MDA1214496.1 zinc ribbon domain-containing protein [Planctomycetota bacterium]